MRVVVTGSRGWTKLGPILHALSKLPLDTIIVHGGAKGADALAEDAAKQLGMTTEVHFAEWERLGRSAGPNRNEQMLDSKPDLVLAFWDGSSRGTKHCIEGARKRGLPVEVIEDGGAT